MPSSLRPPEGKITLKANEVGNNLHLSVADTGGGHCRRWAEPALWSRSFRPKPATRQNQWHRHWLVTYQRIGQVDGGEIYVESKRAWVLNLTLFYPLPDWHPKKMIFPTGHFFISTIQSDNSCRKLSASKQISCLRYHLTDERTTPM